jgi:hypothetical protein
VDDARRLWGDVPVRRRDLVGREGPGRGRARPRLQGDLTGHVAPAGHHLRPAGDTVRRVRFIKHAQELGFSLKEIKELLSLRASPKAQSTKIRERAVSKINDIEERIRALQAMKKALGKLVAECSGYGSVSACPILEALDAEKQE